jgi:hypothetical protein
MAVKHRDINGVDEWGQVQPTAEDWRRTPGFAHYADTDEDLRRRAKGLPPKGKPERIPRVYGAALLLFGVPFWPVAAWYLASGWRTALNAILAFLRQGYALPVLAGISGLAAAIIVGAIYSRIELKPPLRERDWRRAGLLWLVWLVVMGTDVWATFTGLERPSAVGGLLAAVLTFGPDQAIMRGWRILTGRPPF